MKNYILIFFIMINIYKHQEKYKEVLKNWKNTMSSKTLF